MYGDSCCPELLNVNSVTLMQPEVHNGKSARDRRRERHVTEETRGHPWLSRPWKQSQLRCRESFAESEQGNVTVAGELRTPHGSGVSYRRCNGAHEVRIGDALELKLEADAFESENFAEHGNPLRRISLGEPTAGAQATQVLQGALMNQSRTARGTGEVHVVMHH